MPGLRRQRKWLVGLVVMSLVLSLGISAQAVHLFNDVPNLPANIHDATEWLANRAVTLGCAALLYCPNDFVTRAQMALFMHRLGVALTPQTIRANQINGAVDPDALPIVCQTPDFAVTGYPRQALLNAVLTLQMAGAAQWYLQLMFSTNSGASWTWVNSIGGSPNFQRSSITANATEWSTASHADGPLPLTVGTTYRFGIAAGRVTGTADATDNRCDLVVEILNRNGTSTPLSVRGGGDTRR